MTHRAPSRPSVSPRTGAIALSRPAGPSPRMLLAGGAALALMLAAGAAFVAPAFAQGPSPAPSAQTAPAKAAASRSAIIDRASAALSQVNTAQGRFFQVDPYGETATGAFYISRPGRIRFEYVSPEVMYVTSDGVSVAIEEPRRDTFDAVPLSATPLNIFLKSDIDLKRSAKVTGVETVDGVHYVTIQDPSGEAEGEMTLEFDGAFELRGWATVDGSGNVTRIRLADVKTNVKVPAAKFVVKDPEDLRDDRR